jgi:hypothetical protein
MKRSDLGTRVGFGDARAPLKRPIPLGERETRDTAYMHTGRTNSIALIRHRVGEVDLNVSSIVIKIRDMAPDSCTRGFRDYVKMVKSAVIRGEGQGMDVRRVIYVMSSKGGEVIQEGYTKIGRAIFPVKEEVKRRKEAFGKTCEIEGELKSIVIVASGKIKSLKKWLEERSRKAREPESKALLRGSGMKALSKIIKSSIGKGLADPGSLWIREEKGDSDIDVISLDFKSGASDEKERVKRFIMFMLETIIPTYTTMERCEVFARLFQLASYEAPRIREVLGNYCEDAFTIEIASMLIEALLHTGEWESVFTEVRRLLDRKGYLY